MRRFILLAALLIGGATYFQDISIGHGGTYRGPGDTVPGGGGGGGGGGTGPGVGGPTGPTGSGTGQGSPTGGLPPGVPTGTGGGARGTTSTGGTSGGADLTTWEFWWGFNKDPYLQLKSAIHAPVQVTDVEEFFGGKSRAASTMRPSEQTIREKIVPALKRALASETSNDIVTGCLIALGKIGDVQNGEDGTSEFESLIAAFLRNPSQEIAETAAVALGILADDASVPTLRALMLDTPEGRKLVGTTEVPYRTRAFAAYGLGLAGNRVARNETRQEIVRALFEALDGPEGSTRDVKVGALIALGLVPVDVRPANSLGEGRDASASRESQIAAVRRLFLDARGASLVRAHAPVTLARLCAGAPESERDAVATLLLGPLDPFSKERDEVRQGCVLALGMIGRATPSRTDDAIRAALSLTARDSDVQSRQFALIALGQVAGRGTTSECEDPRRVVRNQLLESFTRGGNRARPWAALALGVLERELLDAGQVTSNAVRETLTEGFVESRSPDHVGATAIALGIGQFDAAKTAVAKKLGETSDPITRGYLCVSLGLLGARETVPQIREIVSDSKFKPELLRQAAVGLGLLGDKDVVKELVTMLDTAQGLSSQAAIASALGFIGDSRSVDPLVEMLERREGLTQSARGFAAVALGIVADKESLPWNSKISVNLQYRAATTTLTGESGTGILDIL